MKRGGRTMKAFNHILKFAAFLAIGALFLACNSGGGGGGGQEGPPGDITPGDITPGGITTVWPSNNVWSHFGLPGLKQPSGTTVEVDGPNPDPLQPDQDYIDIRFFGDDDDLFEAYEHLRSQLIEITGPEFEHEDLENSLYYQDRFTYTKISANTAVYRYVRIRIGKKYYDDGLGLNFTIEATTQSQKI